MCVQLLKYNLPILYSIIPILRSVAMLPRRFRPPIQKILDPPLTNYKLPLSIATGLHYKYKIILTFAGRLEHKGIRGWPCEEFYDRDPCNARPLCLPNNSLES